MHMTIITIHGTAKASPKNNPEYDQPGLRLLIGLP